MAGEYIPLLKVVSEAIKNSTQWRGLLCVLDINYIEVNNLKVIFGANHKNLNPAYLEIFWEKAPLYYNFSCIFYYFTGDWNGQLKAKLVMLINISKMTSIYNDMVFMFYV